MQQGGCGAAIRRSTLHQQIAGLIPGRMSSIFGRCMCMGELDLDCKAIWVFKEGRKAQYTVSISTKCKIFMLVLIFVTS